ncbi:snRNA-activating protein complex subunit 3-like isoform X2 [Artemia franciscana]|nr:hypothetical protein QYM36_017176 [Artemia franciscana]KAK2705047.1 hypothetical protein QYM36_017176 [Artemia franciscana]
MDKVYEADKHNFVSEPFQAGEVLQSLHNYLRGAADFVSQCVKTDGNDRLIFNLESIANFFGIDPCDVAQALRRTNLKIYGSKEVDASFLPLSIPNSNKKLSKKECANPCELLARENKKLFRRINPPAVVPRSSSKRQILLADYKAMKSVYIIKILNPGIKNSSNIGFDDHVDFMFHGDQKLTALRDCVPCLNNYAHFQEVSEDPKNFKKDEPRVSSIFPGGMLYIGNTCYDDTRIAGATRYSDCLVPWSEKLGMENKFRKSSMEESTFNDLELRLGFPYVYKHFGSCEHLLVFTEVRLFHPTDPQDLNSYPILLKGMKPSEERCYLCDLPEARWLVTNCPKMDYPRTNICVICLESFLYKDGEKVCDFKLWPLDFNPEFRKLITVQPPKKSQSHITIN